MIAVMSFNVRGTGDARIDGINAWENRRKLNIATIQKYAPDILGFQEAKQGNLEAYEQALTDYESFRGLGASREHGSEYTPIFWKKGLFSLAETGQFYLSESPEKESLGWESGLVRVAAWVKLRVTDSAETLFVLNTHFPHEAAAEETRKHCADLIVKMLDTHAVTLPIIVMGDFNTIPNSAAYRVFLAMGLSDTFIERHETSNTFHNFVGEKYPRKHERIDWILTRHCVADDFHIVRDAEAPLFPSDHYPVLAKIGIKKR